MNPAFVKGVLVGLLLYFVYVHYVAKVPVGMAKPGNGG